jgi:hypothetical protein
MAIQLKIHIRTVILLATGVFVCLLFFYGVDILFDHAGTQDKLLLELQKSYHLMFDFNLEANPPTHYSALLLLTNSILLLIIATAERQSGGEFVLQWHALALLFFLLAFDESATLHEKITYPVHLMLEGTGISPRFFWIVLLVVVTIAGLLFFRKFLLRLNRRMLALFILSGILYTLGVLMVDMFSAWFILPDHARSDMIYRLMVGIEEVFEFLGIVTFLYTHLLIVSKGAPVLDVSIRFVNLSPEKGTDS